MHPLKGVRCFYVCINLYVILHDGDVNKTQTFALHLRFKKTVTLTFVSVSIGRKFLKNSSLCYQDKLTFIEGKQNSFFNKKLIKLWTWCVTFTVTYFKASITLTITIVCNLFYHMENISTWNKCNKKSLIPWKNSDKTFSLEQFLSTIWPTRLVNNSFLYKEYSA